MTLDAAEISGSFFWAVDDGFLQPATGLFVLRSLFMGWIQGHALQLPRGLTCLGRTSKL
jgi:hypothetical protein